MIWCKSCWANGRAWEMKPECWNSWEQIYLLSCTNPNHSYGVWRQLINGLWYPVELSNKKQSQWVGGEIEYRSGGKTHKIKESHLKDIRSRRSNPDGSVNRKSRMGDNSPITWEE